jgi:hypothetical protein
MIDLMKFCGDKKHRVAIGEPFSLGEWSYATDGHILIRVPRRIDIPEREKVPDVERIWPKGVETTFRSPKVTVLPPKEEVDCDICDGRGFKHDCPDCTCECEECNGTGLLSKDKRLAVPVGHVTIAMRYARALLELPALELSVSPAGAPVLQFRFDGGDGILTTIRHSHERDISEIEI